eukprot:310766_1
MAMFLFLLVVVNILGLPNALYVINSTGTDITCDQNDNCLVYCDDCNSRTITCQASYSCHISCESCGSAQIIADQVNDFEFTCTNNCNNAVISSTLSSIDAHAMVNCPNQCQGIHIAISHILSIYNSSIQDTNTSVIINCIGTCYRPTFRSTIIGHLSIQCYSFESCYDSWIVFNPPLNAGTMHIDCHSSRSCARTHLWAVSARQVSVNCGHINSSTGDQDPACYGFDVYGSLYPFDNDETDYSFDTMHNDTIVWTCHDSECDYSDFHVPYGEYQASITRSNVSGSPYAKWCGYGFDSIWQIQCDCQKAMSKYLLYPLTQGANIIIINRYTSDVNCPASGDCIIYAFGGSNTRTVRCPTDRISECHIYTTESYDGAGYTIDARQSRLLFLYSHDWEGQQYVFMSATIYAPDDPLHGAIVIPTATIYGFQSATIYAENVRYAAVGSANSGFQSASWYAGDSHRLHIVCSYHSMCWNMKIYTNHHTFDANSGSAADLIPDNICVECSDHYSASCRDLRLFVNDTTTNTLHTFTESDQKIGEDYQHYWNYQGRQINIPWQYKGPCAGLRSDILYGGYSYCTGIPPKECQYSSTGSVYSWYFGMETGGSGSPVSEDFCYSSHLYSMEESWKQQCFGNESNSTIIYYEGNTACAGNAAISTADGHCNTNKTCGCASYELHSFYEYAAACNESNLLSSTQQAIFVDECYSDGYVYECTVINGVNTILLHEYKDRNCTSNDVTSTILMQEETCFVNKFASHFIPIVIGSVGYVSEISCNCDTTTSNPTSNPTANPTSNPAVRPISEGAVDVQTTHASHTQPTVDAISQRTLVPIWLWAIAIIVAAIVPACITGVCCYYFKLVKTRDITDNVNRSVPDTDHEMQNKSNVAEMVNPGAPKFKLKPAANKKQQNIKKMERECEVHHVQNDNDSDSEGLYIPQEQVISTEGVLNVGKIMQGSTVTTQSPETENTTAAQEQVIPTAGIFNVGNIMQGSAVMTKCPETEKRTDGALYQRCIDCGKQDLGEIYDGNGLFYCNQCLMYYGSTNV